MQVLIGPSVNSAATIFLKASLQQVTFFGALQRKSVARSLSLGLPKSDNWQTALLVVRSRAQKRRKE
jgi:hypothetical protein